LILRENKTDVNEGKTFRSQNRTRTSPLEGRRMVVDETGRRVEWGGAWEKGEEKRERILVGWR